MTFNDSRWEQERKARMNRMQKFDITPGTLQFRASSAAGLVVSIAENGNLTIGKGYTAETALFECMRQMAQKLGQTFPENMGEVIYEQP